MRKENNEDKKPINWLATAAIAIIRSASSTFVITAIYILSDRFGRPDAANPMLFSTYCFLFMVFMSQLYYYFLKGLHFALSKMVGGIAGTVVDLMIVILSLAVACGDPILRVINQFLPEGFAAERLKMFNLVMLIIVTYPDPKGENSVQIVGQVRVPEDGEKTECDFHEDNNAADWQAPQIYNAPLPSPDAAEVSRDISVPKKNNVILIGAMATCFLVAMLIAGKIFISHTPQPSAPQGLPDGVTAFLNPVTEKLPSGPTALNANERSGAGANFASVGVAMAGSAITEVGRATDQAGKPWLVIRRDDGSYAFIKERLVHPGAAVASVAQPPSPPSATFMITAAGMNNDVRHGMPYADVRNFTGPTTTLGLFANYNNARTGDVIRSSVQQDGRMVTACDDYIVQSVPAGGFWCQIGSIGTGSYNFVVTVNGQQVATYPFNVS